MPILTNAYKPCPLKNSNLVYRVLPVNSQCGSTAPVPTVMFVSGWTAAAPSPILLLLSLNSPSTLSVTAWNMFLCQHLIFWIIFTPFWGLHYFYISLFFVFNFKKVILTKCCCPLRYFIYVCRAFPWQYVLIFKNFLCVIFILYKTIYLGNMES